MVLVSMLQAAYTVTQNDCASATATYRVSCSFVMSKCASCLQSVLGQIYCSTFKSVAGCLPTDTNEAPRGAGGC